MKKQIIVESPMVCPYQKILDYHGEVIRRWCSYRGYDGCNKYEFPKDCPLDDFPEDIK